MKRLMLCMLAGLLLGGFSACTSEESPQEPPQTTPSDPDPEPDPDPIPEGDELDFVVTTEMQVVEVDPTFRRANLTFEVDQAWELHLYTYDQEGDTSWVTPTQYSGEAGKQTITIDFAVNETELSRGIRIDISPRGDMVRSDESDKFLDGSIGVMATISILQSGYYMLGYEPLQVTLTEDVRLGEQMDAYVAQQGILHTDVKALKLEGVMLKKDYDYIREKLVHLKILDLFSTTSTSIPDEALMGASSLHHITLPSHLTKIGARAFMNSGLRNVNLQIPPYVNYIGEYAFANTNLSGMICFASFLRTLNINGGIFQNTYIMAVIFGEGITHINENTTAVVDPFFQTSLMYIYLPATLRSMNNYLFHGSYISRVDCLAANPPSMAGVPEYDCVGIFCVPFFSYDAYSADENWGYFDFLGRMMPVFL